MIRRLAAAAVLVGVFTAAGATAASALPMSGASTRGVCVAVHAVDVGLCMSK